MENPPQNLMQDYSTSFNYNLALKSKDYPQKAKGMSFFAFVISIFLYISILYVYKISPSNLVNNSKFWFVISNTLLLIIAMDYGTFYSCKGKHDLYQDYVVRKQVMYVQSQSPMPQHPEIVKACDLSEEEIDHDEKNEPRISDKSLINAVSTNETSSNVSCSTQEEKNDGNNSVIVINPVHEVIESTNIVNHNEDVKIDEKEDVDEEEDADKEIIKTSTDDDSNGYANMSTEELNKKCDEFIERFNTQIRLEKQVEYQLLYLND